MKNYIFTIVLIFMGMGLRANNPVREGNIIDGHVLVKGSEENIPYATIQIVGHSYGTVSNEEG